MPTPRLFIGMTLRDGEGAPPATWAGVPPKPYREVHAGLTTRDLIFDEAGRPDALQPRLAVGYSEGGGGRNFRLELWRDLEPDAAGRPAVGAQATYAALGPDGKPGTRIDLQIASSPPVPGATAQLAGRVEQFVPIDDRNALRLRATAAHSGVPGQTVGASVSVAINPPPSTGAFPAPGSAMRLGAELTVSRAPAPLDRRPVTATDTVAVTAALFSPDTVLIATGSRDHRPDNVEQVRLTGTAMMRLGSKDIGDPPTTVTAGGVDPIGMPTGRYPAGARGSNTTAYARFAVTLDDNGAQPKPGAALGRDSITVGVSHTESHGVLAGAYVVGTVDATRYAEGTSPASRAAVTAGAHLRPADDVPVTIHLSANAGGVRGNSVSTGVTVMPDRNTAIEAGARFDFTHNEVQPYAQVRIRL